MLHIFGFIFLMVIIILIAGIFLIINLVRGVLGIGNHRSRKQDNQYEKKDSSETIEYGKKNKKIFDKEDGEYVEFEEIE